LFTSVPGELDPLYDPVVGSFEVQNQGEFYANSIHLLLWASWTDPLAASATNPPVPIPIGTLSNFVCSTGSPSSTPGKCDWTQTTYPEEMKIVNFVFDKNYWDLGNGDNLANCINYDKNSLPCDDPSGNATYAHSGQTVKINANITYDYNVNVSIPVDVIDFTVYQKLLQANEITLQDLTSQYTGGPVKATLWSQRQPIRAGETSLFVASIYNEGDGEIESIGGFSIKIPTALGTPTIVSSTFYTGSIGNDGCNLNQNEIFCQHNVAGSGIKTGEYRTPSFFITPTTTQGVDRISRLITGLATYKYVKTVSKSITVANAPLH
jgi:hypothetical protein